MSGVNAYPVPKPEHGGTDDRFTMGLILDVADCLERHGYPRPATPSDWSDLQQALYVLLHVSARRP